MRSFGNYEILGLFDEHPAILQGKKKKKKQRLPGNGADDGKPRSCSSRNSEPVGSNVPKKKMNRSVQVQTQTPVYLDTTVPNPDSG